MKRTSFVCFGAQGNKDSLVYQEIPGRDGGEEFFVFFSPGDSAQESLLRTLFREAVSASRLGAPEHFFTRFIAHFKAQTAGAASDGDAIGGALIMIHMRRGNEVHILTNRDATLVHWNGSSVWGHPAESLPGFSAVFLGGASEQRDLFQRAPEDLFVLNRFTIGEGDHTLILVPSDDFAARHAESLRDSVFFPAFEVPHEIGVELAVSRSFPALHWRTLEREKALPAERPPRRSTRALVPAAALALTALVAVALILGPLGGHRRAGVSKEPGALLSASDGGTSDSAAGGSRPVAAPGLSEGAQRNPTRQAALVEAWRAEFKAAVTSSPVFCDGRIYFGCKDGSLYAYTPEGVLSWSYRSGAPIGASPCCAAGRVLCANYRGDLFCLDETTGALIWSVATRAKIVCTPRVREGLVVVGTTDGRLVAVRSDTGRHLWERKLGAPVWASPALGPNYVVAATTGGSLVRLDARGKTVWKARTGGSIFSSPLCIDEKNLAVFGGGRFVNAYSLSGGKRIWRFSTGSTVDGSPSRGSDAILVGATNGILYAITFAGSQQWQCPLPGAVHSRPLVSGTTVFVTTYASRLVALDAATGRIVGEYRSAAPAYSSPESDGSRIYFGTNNGVLHAVWLRSPAT